MIITSNNDYRELDEWMADKNKVFLVCDDSIQFLAGINDKLNRTNKNIIRFSNFRPNPLYESVIEGVKVFRETECDCIFAVGGGSAMDVAKCIKLYARCDGDGTDGSWLKETVDAYDIPFLAMPTTAGTGSEATKYAVVYYGGLKQSITSDSIIPDTILMDPSVLKTLPIYQKKSTMMDALCHAIESFWSVNSTNESKRYSDEAIRLIIENMDGYLTNSECGNERMLHAAHIAGKAINITQTTAGHAMSYKITSLFGVAHGHAAILCDRVLFPWMINNIDKCIDIRGDDYLKVTLDEIGHALGCEDARSGAIRLNEIFNSMKFEIPSATKEQFEELTVSVNPVRLKNHPILMDADTIKNLYHEVLK